MKHAANCGAGHVVAELAQLTFDAQISPSWIVRGQPDDEIPRVRRDRWPADATAAPERRAFRCTRCRCQRTTVSGQTPSDLQAERSNRSARAARMKRSPACRRGRPAVRWSTLSWCRSTRISSSRRLLGVVGDLRGDLDAEDFTHASSGAFSGYRWPPDVIVTAVRWYLELPALRPVTELLAGRGIDVSARTVLTWTQTFGPQLATAARRHRRRLGRRW